MKIPVPPAGGNKMGLEKCFKLQLDIKDRGSGVT